MYYGRTYVKANDNLVPEYRCFYTHNHVHSYQFYENHSAFVFICLIFRIQVKDTIS